MAATNATNTRSQHTASVSEQQRKHREAVPRQQPTVDSKNSQINAASEHACHTPEGAAQKVCYSRQIVHIYPGSIISRALTVLMPVSYFISEMMMIYLHCLFVCSDVGIYDRVIIQELLKTVAQSHQLDSSSQRDFKGFNVISHSVCG